MFKVQLFPRQLQKPVEAYEYIQALRGTLSYQRRYINTQSPLTLPRNQKERRRLTVFRLGALAGSLLTQD